jgi:hypothetical protein
MTDFVSGDTGSTLLVTCTDDAGEVINISGSTVKIRWKEAAGTVAEKDMTVTDGAAGECSYKFAAGELFAPGMAFEIEITDSGSFKLTNVDLIAVTVRKELA